jgi:hypothetical protein
MDSTFLPMVCSDAAALQSFFAWIRWTICCLQQTRTALYYTLVWDDSIQPVDAARQKQINTYHLLFEKMLRNMKKLAEGGSLSPEDKQAPVVY